MPKMNMFPGTWKDILPGRNIFSPVSGRKAESYSRFARHRRSSVVPGGHSPRLRLGGRWCVCVCVCACEEWSLCFHVMTSPNGGRPREKAIQEHSCAHITCNLMMQFKMVIYSKLFLP